METKGDGVMGSFSAPPPMPDPPPVPGPPPTSPPEGKSRWAKVKGRMGTRTSTSNDVKQGGGATANKGKTGGFGGRMRRAVKSALRSSKSKEGTVKSLEEPMKDDGSDDDSDTSDEDEDHHGDMSKWLNRSRGAHDDDHHDHTDDADAGAAPQMSAPMEFPMSGGNAVQNIMAAKMAAMKMKRFMASRKKVRSILGEDPGETKKEKEVAEPDGHRRAVGQLFMNTISDVFLQFVEAKIKVEVEAKEAAGTSRVRSMSKSVRSMTSSSRSMAALGEDSGDGSNDAKAIASWSPGASKTLFHPLDKQGKMVAKTIAQCITV